MPRIVVSGLIFLLLIVMAAEYSELLLKYQAAQDTIDQMGSLVDAYSLVRERYVQEVDDRALQQGALQGLVEALEDPYSEYLSPENYRKLQVQVTGSFGGIGVVMTFWEGNIVIVDPPMAGSPAEAAGLQTGDVITSVDGEPLEGLTLDQAAELIRGPVGTEVDLGIRRGEELLEVTLVREQIPIISVRSQVLEEETGIGYLRISIFNEHTGAEVKEALAALEKQGVQGLVLDLRRNPGGILKGAVEVAGLFLPAGEPVLHVRDRDGEQQSINTFEEPLCPDMPLVVLVDGGSASAAEIVAGALQDTGRAPLVGTKTFGKGSVQTIYPLGDAGAVRLTTALYMTAGGHFINKQGILPDVTVEYDQESERDEQLEAAVALLRESLS
ncbi:MAG TPA: S41 family peptidase [Firmicutes bacterium]|nr:S41 family peptidase [Bacillota bacterium]